MFCLSADRFELAFNVLTAVVISDSNNSAIQKALFPTLAVLLSKSGFFRKPGCLIEALLLCFRRLVIVHRKVSNAAWVLTG